MIPQTEKVQYWEKFSFPMILNAIAPIPFISTKPYPAHAQALAPMNLLRSSFISSSIFSRYSGLLRIFINWAVRITPTPTAHKDKTDYNPENADINSFFNFHGFFLRSVFFIEDENIFDFHFKKFCDFIGKEN